MQIWWAAGAELLRAAEQAHWQVEEWADGPTDMTRLFEILRTLLKIHVKTNSAFMFCVDLRTNSDNFPIQF